MYSVVCSRTEGNLGKEAGLGQAPPMPGSVLSSVHTRAHSVPNQHSPREPHSHMMEGWDSDRESHLSTGYLLVIRLPLQTYCENTASHSADHLLLHHALHLDQLVQGHMATQRCFHCVRLGCEKQCCQGSDTQRHPVQP